MAVAALTSKGQITLPKEIREQLKLQPGIAWKFLWELMGGLPFVRLPQMSQF
ncbi:AbrB/MazE/SpoVT family DNA-binding domain-containing protein [Candidatus Nitrospira allomarina]|jgi:bifunctional DNA-binding transcriptional regulator/antitoxin component of YhaV-PrlF toxin-antitoxin module|uniref:AbrB/MazE/SpoVT family DNA-binding domain-containing protein n=1 Tax=Candidatus Nitrospira allomarina TaxID=3020900 RepID=A0AA96GB73_9BACT|nr:AbrB/MazE/SpoVT family DNA-binding domain-containing protein [Candidatus Nitrospira allomarina]WNM57802.1 AbrB/MazE/SpoVT family DNA-binding domain-containing protein [Candidatus Nitrospira allomarina]